MNLVNLGLDFFNGGRWGTFHQLIDRKGDVTAVFCGNDFTKTLCTRLLILEIRISYCQQKDSAHCGEDAAHFS